MGRSITKATCWRMAEVRVGFAVLTPIFAITRAAPKATGKRMG
jgi:hypothetical protein